MKKRPPDVLIVGSSRALRGVDPLALSRALVSQGHSNLDIFNFGINGATAQVVDCLIRQILEPEELPKLILWADGSRAFNNGREDITFNAIAVSQGYKQVLQKTITRVNADAVNKNKEGFRGEISSKSATKDINIYQAADSWLNQSLSGLSASYKNREQIKTLLQKKFENLPFSYQYPQVKSKVNLTSYSAMTNSLQRVDFDGFLPISVRFNPATYYQKYPKVSGDYDNDYKSFQLAGKQEQAFRSVLDFTKKNNISLVFVNMPLTSDYLDPVRTKYEQQFQKHLLKFTGDPHFIYRDLSQLWPTASNYFSDPSHINRYGAYEVSKNLALDPIISWTKK
jgi:disulfide oxidoreductase YuzD